MANSNDLNSVIVGGSNVEPNTRNQSNLPFHYFGNDNKPRRVLTFIDDDGGAFVLDQISTDDGTFNANGNFPGFWLSDKEVIDNDKIHYHGVIDQINTKYPGMFPDNPDNHFQNLNFKMGFAIITRFSGDAEGPDTPTTPTHEYGYLTKDQVTTLQTAGYEIYSHTENHIDANIPGNLRLLSTEYCDSKKWLNENGFSDNSNVLVYPGGLNPDQQDNFESVVSVVRSSGYDYAINTELADNFHPKDGDEDFTFRRINFDEHTYDEIINIIESSSYSIDHSKNPPSTTPTDITDRDGWFIAMTHAYVIKNDQSYKNIYYDDKKQLLYNESLDINVFKAKQDKILAVVQYCFDNNIDILPFSEAVKCYNK